MEKADLVFLAVLRVLGFLPLGPDFPLLDVEEYLSRVFLASARVHLLPAKSTNHPLENMANLRLEMVLMIMGPVQQREYEWF